MIPAKLSQPNFPSQTFPAKLSHTHPLSPNSSQPKRRPAKKALLQSISQALHRYPPSLDINQSRELAYLDFEPRPLDRILRAQQELPLPTRHHLRQPSDLDKRHDPKL